MGPEAAAAADAVVRREAAPAAALFDPQLEPGAAPALLDGNAPAGSTALGGGSDPAVVRVALPGQVPMAAPKPVTRSLVAASMSVARQAQRTVNMLPTVVSYVSTVCSLAQVQCDRSELLRLPCSAAWRWRGGTLMVEVMSAQTPSLSCRLCLNFA